jgi:hypothetical protein
MDPDPKPGGPKTYGSDGSGSATLLLTKTYPTGAVRTRQTAGTKSLVAKFARTDQRKFILIENGGKMERAA